MKYTSSLLFSVMLFMIFSSCQKEVDSTNNAITAPANNDSFYLDKTYDIYDNGSGVDTQSIWIFNYDNDKRLVSMIAPVTNTDHVQLFYYYNGNDSLPYLTVITDESASVYTDTETVYHYYDANQRKIKDSTIHTDNNGFISVAVVNFTYDAGIIYGETAKTILTPATPTEYYRDTATLDANGNITHNKGSHLVGSNYVLYRVSDFTYDTHTNPFSKLNISKSMSSFPNGETLFWEMRCINNIITQNETTYSSATPFVANLSNAYTYNQSGLPSTCIIDFTTDTEEVNFTYKHL